jgi:capsular polysaccharide biosynthesis protein
MEMEFISLIKVIWRWLWLIILIVATTLALLYFNPNWSFVDYRADVTVLLTSPDREDVQVLDDYVFTSERDEITIAINKFIEIAQYPEVRTRTLLELGDVEDYDVEVRAELGADFVYLTVTSSNPELAAQIANTHVAKAIEYFGEIRALTATEANTYLATSLATAEQELLDAETALSTFQAEHNVVQLDTEIELQYDVLAQLEISRAQLLVSQATAGQTRSMDSAGGEIDPVIVTAPLDMAGIDALISTQREVLANLSVLEPEYLRLVQDLEFARANHETVSTLASNTELRGSFASEAMFIQVIQPATAPNSPEDYTVRTLGLGAAASFGAAILLVFFLDYLVRKW